MGEGAVASGQRGIDAGDMDDPSLSANTHSVGFCWIVPTLWTRIGASTGPRLELLSTHDIILALEGDLFCCRRKKCYMWPI